MSLLMMAVLLQLGLVALFLSSRWLHQANWGISNIPMLNVFHIFLTPATFIYHFIFFVAMFTIIIPDSQKSAPQIIILLDQNQVHVGSMPTLPLGLSRMTQSCVRKA